MHPDPDRSTTAGLPPEWRLGRHAHPSPSRSLLTQPIPYAIVIMGLQGALMTDTARTTPRLDRLRVKNLRSIGDEGIQVALPHAGPLVLLGENNAGKSNLVRSIEMLFGERWPKNLQVDDHDFFNRDSDGISIDIAASVSGLRCDCGGEVNYIKWSYSARVDGDPCAYERRCTTCVRTFMSNVLRQQLFAMVIGADRRLSYQLSYTSQYTLLSRLMRRLHDKLTADPERRTVLAGIFQSIVEQFEGVAEFSTFRGLLAETSEHLAQNLPYRLDVDFSAYDPSNFFRSLRIHPQFEGEVRSFDELGTGQEQILALAFSYAYAQAFGDYEGLLLVVEEPESHLHPLAQLWLAKRLGDMAGHGLQIAITTHSPHFVDLSRPENLIVVSKPDRTGTKAIQTSRPDLVQKLKATGADPHRTTEASVGEFYSSSATTQIVSALFSRLCVLVEGKTEELSLPDLLRLADFDALKEGVAVVSAEGVSSIARWVRLFTAFNIPTYCVFDTDSDKNGGAAAGPLASRQDIMQALSVDPIAADSDKLSPDPLHVEPRYATLDANFESAMPRLLGPAWDQAYAEALSEVGASKPLRARYAVKLIAERRAAELADLDISPLAGLAGALRALLGTGAKQGPTTIRHSEASSS